MVRKQYTLIYRFFELQPYIKHNRNRAPNDENRYYVVVLASSMGMAFTFFASNIFEIPSRWPAVCAEHVKSHRFEDSHSSNTLRYRMLTHTWSFGWFDASAKRKPRPDSRLRGETVTPDGTL